MSERSRRLRAAALEAYLCGSMDTAELLYRTLLDTCGLEPEAKEAESFIRLGHPSITPDGALPITAHDLHRLAFVANGKRDDLLASTLFRRVVLGHPGTPEAQDAVRYLTETPVDGELIPRPAEPPTVAQS